MGLTGGAGNAGLKWQIQDKGAYTGRVGYTHRPCGQGQALSDLMAVESSKSPLAFGQAEDAVF